MDRQTFRPIFGGKFPSSKVHLSFIPDLPRYNVQICKLKFDGLVPMDGDVVLRVDAVDGLDEAEDQSASAGLTVAQFLERNS
jgi:hypothetical protein